MEVLSTRQVGQRIRRKTLPEFSDGGIVSCICHPRTFLGDTESLRFWQKGSKVWCPKKRRFVHALARYSALGITIDTSK
jgi:hypothetical protein